MRLNKHTRRKTNDVYISWIDFYLSIIFSIGYKMNKQIEALKMAQDFTYSLMQVQNIPTALTVHNACKEALAEVEKQEPIAWIEYRWEDEGDGLMYPVTYLHEYDNGDSKPLYTHPATWQSLSDDEITSIIHDNVDVWEFEDVMVFARAIEQALKKKNHD